MERSQFTFYSSFAKAAERIKKKTDRCDFYDIVKNYALYGEQPDLDSCADAVAIAFELIKPTLDASRKKAQSGKVGGSKKESESKPQANGKQNESKPQGNRKGEETAREKEGEKEKEKENECYPPTPLSGETKAKRFSPPTVDEVEAYCQERKNGVDPQRFIDHYTANGWKVGKNPMKDWKAAVRTWEGGESKPQSGGKPTKAQELDEFYGMVSDWANT